MFPVVLLKVRLAVQMGMERLTMDTKDLEQSDRSVVLQALA